MSAELRPRRILLVTGLSGAGKSTALKTLEDIGWEVVDNLPFSLLDRLLDTSLAAGVSTPRPFALGIDTRTRGFDAEAIIERIGQMRDAGEGQVATLFLDCSGAELERRYSETRRRHPLAPDRPASDGIARERELLSLLRSGADHVIDTTSSSTNDLKLELRNRFAETEGVETVLSVMSFGFARGIPRNADLVFDVRFLRNPHWDLDFRPLTGLDGVIGAYISADPAYAEAMQRIEELILMLIPRYHVEGKAYLTIAFGCTGGRHRSVHVAERMAGKLRESGYSPTLAHRDIGEAGTQAESGEEPVRTDKTELQ
jgi:UPF0042 nucleotide-binding protein